MKSTTKWLALIALTSSGACSHDPPATPPDTGPAPMPDAGAGPSPDSATPDDAGAPGDATPGADVPMMPPGDDPWNAPGMRRPLPDSLIQGMYVENSQMPAPGTGMAPNLSCDNVRTAPMAGMPISFTLEVTDFQENTPVANVCVKFFPDNAIVEAPCMPGTGMDFMTDDNGRITVTDAAGSWYGFRIFPRMGPTASRTVVGTIQINEAAPMTAGATVEGRSVSQSTLNLIPTVLGFPRAAGTAMIAGTTHDCDERAVYGLHARVYSADRTPISEGTGPMDTHFRYFNGDDFPSGEQPWSHVDGLFAIGNIPIPADGQPVYLETWGRRTAGGPVEMIGCERVTLLANTVSIMNVGPKRMDGPTGCSR